MPDAMHPLVILTRPHGRNDLLAARLRGHGLPALDLPALEIFPLSLDGAGFPLPQQYDLIVFVSANAARLYIDELHRRHKAGWPACTLAATVGQASAAPLRESGLVPDDSIVHPAVEQAQDSEALWAKLCTLGRHFRRVAIVRGESGREWLGGQLEQAGAVVHRYPIYGRRPAAWTTEQRARLAGEMTSGRWFISLFTSSEGIEAYRQNLLSMNAQEFWRRTHFVAIHERVASRLQSLPEVRVGTPAEPVVKICQPVDEAIIQTIISLAPPEAFP